MEIHASRKKFQKKGSLKNRICCEMDHNQKTIIKGSIQNESDDQIID